MIKIEFSYAQRYDQQGRLRPTCVRSWPAVPRVGELIEIEGIEMGGYVHQVFWLDDGKTAVSATVHLK